MNTFIIRLDPSTLDNPDADIRYQLPDLLAERSGGTISDDGYDYVGDKPYLVIFLKALSTNPALTCILDVLENVRLLGNDLRSSSVVAVDTEDGRKIVYPPGFTDSFLPGSQ